MKKRRFGFTLVEVSLFLAVTAALFIGVIAGTQNTIWHQRFNDSVENFAEFLRSVYSQVANPQSIGTGQSDTAIYGKLIVFGESTGLSGEGNSGKENSKVFVYDVVGDVAGDMAAGEGLIGALKEANINVVVGLTDDGKAVQIKAGDTISTQLKMVTPAGIVESYSPRWMATIEVERRLTSIGYPVDLFTGSVLIVRHPKSGTINTLYSGNVIQVNEKVEMANEKLKSGGNVASVSGVVGGLLTDKLGSFSTARVDFCINPNGQDDRIINSKDEIADLPRRNVRIALDARNASGVEVIDLDLNESVDGVQWGNRCRY